jgi:K+-transporting ATPase ATPase C chain
MKSFITSIKAVLAFTLITGVAYPLLVWASGRLFFSHQAGGSIVRKDEKVIGSSLLAQKTLRPEYLHPRPSSSDYATLPAAGSNAYWTEDALIKRLQQPCPPGEDLTQSASGLDPHLQPEAALLQLDRIGQARHWTAHERHQAEEWIATHTEGGTISPTYINVLMFNLMLDTSTRSR